MLKVKGSVKVSLERCPRCLQAHEEVLLRAMSNPDSHGNVWGKCPNSNEPFVCELRLQFGDRVTTNTTGKETSDAQA